MQIDPRDQAKKANYKLLIGGVLPRPIAFVTSMDKNGVVNAAPFSFFTVVSVDPPMLSVSCMRKPGGVPKDTARNIAETKEYVVHVVDGDNVSMVNQTSTEFPPDVSEAEAVGFDLADSVHVHPPRIVQSKVQMECRLRQILPMGGTPESPDADVIIGEVVLFHVEDALYESGRIDTVGLNPVGRLAGTAYGKLGETFSMPRLSLDEWKEKKEKGKF
ncbi:flavin reductase family protein [Paludifilum halophilum]|uniref:flavin reductase family protein n=1 Tax=Paludifilum halophilum TaxID=1642702 RepID=UPI001F0B03BD|nr:flavin reductase family protein [Paludifilum halophilum]